MDFEWDAEKNEAIRLARGFDVAFAAAIFAGPTIEATDLRFD